MKLGVTDALNALLEPIRQEYATNPKFQESFKLAYPQPEKKAKKVKDKGSKYPGPEKIAKQKGDGVASNGVAEDITSNGQGTGTGGQSNAAPGTGLENALNKLDVKE